MRFALPVAGLLGLAVLAHPPGHQPVESQDLKVTFEEAGPPPYPFQAARLRLIVQNVSGKRVGKIIAPDRVHRITGLKGPQDQEFRRPGAGLVRGGGRDRIIDNHAARHRRNRVPLFLEPGEAIAVSFPVGVEGYREVPGKPELAVSPFPRPGTYTFQCSYLVGVRPGDMAAGRDISVVGSVEVEVGTPRGPDAAVYDLLQEDGRLVSALIGATRPPEQEVVPKLEALLKLYPKSSYAPYVHYALARYHFHQGGPERRVHRARAATHLEAVLHRPFAYRPTAAILMRAADPAATDRVKNLLNKEHPDAIEWLNVVARELGDREWQDFRIRSPKR